jgi:hypothetical protein
LVVVLMCGTLAGCGALAPPQAATQGVPHGPVPVKVCGIARVLAASARTATREDPNLHVGKLAADGNEVGAKPRRFAEFMAPIAARLARSQAALVRSLTRLASDLRTPVPSLGCYLPSKVG